MRHLHFKHLRDWSDDAVWITFGIGVTMAAVLLAWLYVP